MIGRKNSVFYLAALHMIVATTSSKVLEIVNNKPQLKERRKIRFANIFLFLNFIKFVMKYFSTHIKTVTHTKFFFRLRNHKSRLIQNYLQMT